MSWTFPPGSRYYECVVPAVNTEKFWCYRLLNSNAGDVVVEVHWGRIGAAGQSKTFPFKLPIDARDFVNEKVVEKLRKGYLERDRDWVQRMWPQWRPPIAVDALQPTQPRLNCRHQYEEVTTFGALRKSWLCPLCGSRREGPQPRTPLPRVEAATKVNPGRVAPRAPLPARAGRRVIDFTEE